MSKRPRMTYPRLLSGLMPDSLVVLGLAEKLREAEIWRIWPDVVGEALAGRARPVRIINGTLTVAVSSAPWMQELRFMTTIMKEKLNSALGAEVVREIVLKTGRVDKPPAETADEPIESRPLTPEQLALIDANAGSIQDPETRQAFIDMMQAGMAHRR